MRAEEREAKTVESLETRVKSLCNRVSDGVTEACLATRQPGPRFGRSWLRGQVSGAESRGVKLRPAAKSDLEGLGPDTLAGVECTT